MTTDTAADLALAMTGELLGPEDPEIDEARKIANGDHDRHPALVARCFVPDDVSAALGYARRHGLPVAVRRGGHSTPGYSTCEGGMVIDTGPMKEVTIDPDARTGRFGGASTGPSSTPRPRSTAWPSPAAVSPTPASPA